MSGRPACASTIAVVGSAGIPAAYGGFETFAEQLSRFHLKEKAAEWRLIVVGSSAGVESLPSFHLATRLLFIPLPANGVLSPLYDFLSILRVLPYRPRVILLLGVSAAPFILFMRAVTSAKFVTNIDGLEWRRDKWGKLARWYLKASEWCAVRFSHEIVVDNKAIQHYVEDAYGATSWLIEYGGDQEAPPLGASGNIQVNHKRFGLTICRIEPENNIELLLCVAQRQPNFDFVFVGNWEASPYGMRLYREYKDVPHICLRQPCYDPNELHQLRSSATFYLHGHSAGGTNPSLVEIMFYGLPIFAFDCSYNRYTTEDKASFFCNEDELDHLLTQYDVRPDLFSGESLRKVAERRYRWDQICSRYFELFIQCSDAGVRGQ